MRFTNKDIKDKREEFQGLSLHIRDEKELVKEIQKKQRMR